MKLCGTCKHFGNPNQKDEMFRTCNAVIHDERSHHCDVYSVGLDVNAADWVDEEDKAEIRAIRAHKAVVVDGSGYHAALKVQSDFGCVLHEDKGQ